VPHPRRTLGIITYTVTCLLKRLRREHNGHNNQNEAAAAHAALHLKISEYEFRNWTIAIPRVIPQKYIVK
jgi:hypothetical protein